MTLDEQLELFARYDEDAVHGDLRAALDDLPLGRWRELDEPLVADWPYGIECWMLNGLLARLEAVSSTPLAAEAVITTRWLLRPSATPLGARG